MRIIRDHRDEVRDKVFDAAARALNDGAKELLRTANETIPIEEGTMQGSGTVIPATPRKLLATVGYGGEAASYVVRQHEDETLRHDDDRRAKWLEMAAKEDGTRIMTWVAEQMRSELR